MVLGNRGGVQSRLKNHCAATFLEQNPKYVKLVFMRDQYQDLAKQGSKKHWSHVDYLEKLTDGEAALRRDISIFDRIYMIYMIINRL